MSLNAHNTYQKGGQIGQGEGKKIDYYCKTPTRLYVVCLS